MQSNDNQNKSLAVSRPTPKKGVFFAVLMICIVILALGAVSAFAYLGLFASDSSTPASLIFEEVKRGVFVHEVTDRGNVESAQNEDIRCNVESMSGVMIVWIIPEGTAVEEGEVLVRLDSSNLEERYANQEITVANTSAAVKQAKADVSVAELAKIEYEEGTYPKEHRIIENRISKAFEDQSRAKDVLDHTIKLYVQGYSTDMQVRADEAKYEQLEKDFKMAEKELEVLEKYTSKKMLEQYSANIVTAEAQLASANRRNSIETTRLDYLEKQVEYCTIRAPKAGQVVYATPNNPWRRDMDLIKEGMTARERQTLIRLPDPKQMQVAGMVNEASVSLVKVGQPATITLQAMPNQVFNGTVKLVNDFPEPDGPMGSMAKEYKTVVTMDDLDSLPPNQRSGIRPGLTAQIKIDVTDPSIEALPILVPVQTLFEHAGQYYCITCENGKWEKIPVEVGATNDKEVVIKLGLTEGMRVVHGAWRYIKHVLTEEEQTGAKEFGIGGARQQRRGVPGGPGGGPPGGGGPDGPGGGGFGGPGGGSNDGPAGGRGPGAEREPGAERVPGVDSAQPGGGLGNPPGGDGLGRPEGGQETTRGNASQDGAVPGPDSFDRPPMRPPAGNDPSPAGFQPPEGMRNEGNRQPPIDGGNRPNRPPAD